MSETFRHDFRLLVAKLEAGKATPEGEAYIKHVDELTEIARAVGNGDGVLACELIARLPSVLQADRRVLIMKIQAGMHLGGEVLLSAINEFSTRFPNDPATQLYSIQAYMLTGQHDAALRLLGELNESIGGDPYLDALRADVYFQKSDVETATRIATEVIEDEQGFDLAYWTLAKVAAMEARFADAVKWLDALHDVEGRMVDIEEALHEYSGFLDSAEFEMWRQRRLTGQRTNE